MVFPKAEVGEYPELRLYLPLVVFAFQQRVWVISSQSGLYNQWSDWKYSKLKMKTVGCTKPPRKCGLHVHWGELASFNLARIPSETNLLKPMVRHRLDKLLLLNQHSRAVLLWIHCFLTSKLAGVLASSYVYNPCCSSDDSTVYSSAPMKFDLLWYHRKIPLIWPRTGTSI